MRISFTISASVVLEEQLEATAEVAFIVISEIVGFVYLLIILLLS